MAKQLKFKRIGGWGGRRAGAGRPAKLKQVSHEGRECVRCSWPVHITMKVRPEITNLRTNRLLRQFQEAARAAQARGLRINHFALLTNHLHMIAEADDNSHLANGMRAFGGKFGKALRAASGGVGSAFDGRFHAHVLKTPSEYRLALRYVLLNHAKHARLGAHLDRYSSGPYFREWTLLIDETDALGGLDDLPPLSNDFLSTPRSWIGRGGWRRAK